jgi:lipopolysaccharide export LptBFGC system permease protein LptF
MKPAVMAVAAICLFCYHANASWIPQTRHRLKQKTEQMAVDLFLARLRSGRRDFSFPPYDIDIKQVGEGNRLISVNIRASLNEEETKVLVIRAREAVLEAESDGHSSGLKLTMFDGATTLVEPPLSGMPGAPNAPESLPPREWSWEKDVMVIGGQSTEDMPFDEDEQTLASLLSKLRASNTGILDRPKAEPSRTQLIEAHKRLSLSIVSLVFVLLGSPLGMLCRKSNRLLGFASGLILSLGLYYPLLLFGIFLAKRSIVNPWLGLWLPNALFIIAGLWLSRSVLRA